MKTKRIHTILTLSALVVASWWIGARLDNGETSLARPEASITITQPDGVDDIVGEGDDFATKVFGDPWDMEQPTDVLGRHYLSGETFSNGILSYNVQSFPAHQVGLLFPGMPGAVDIGRIGVNYPIDTARYKWLSFRINQPGGFVGVAWTYDQTLVDYRIAYVSAQPGWHTYVVDLSGEAGWDGQPVGLYIVPVGLASGTRVQIDWARLTADNPVDNRLTIAWSELSPAGGKVDFYLDADQTGCDGVLVHTETNAPVSGSFFWQQPASNLAGPTNVAPGEYYVCAKAGSDVAGYSAGRLTVNQAPIIHFTQPSFTSGEDYATDNGNPWDMSDAADVDHVSNGSFSVNNGLLAVTVPAAESDVQVHLNVPSAIDSEQYYYLTYRLLYDLDYSWMDVGQGTRIFWGRGVATEATSAWIYDYPGWQTYHIDLRSLQLVSGPAWNSADWTRFRMDPIANNTGQQVAFFIDDIRLTGDEKADAFVDVEWELTDPDTWQTTMELYYDTNRSGLDGSLIATLQLTDGEDLGPTVSPVANISASLKVTQELTRVAYMPLVLSGWRVPCEGACYTWETAGIAAGEYYLYACVDDGFNRLCRYSERPVLIGHTDERRRSPN